MWEMDDIVVDGTLYSYAAKVYDLPGDCGIYKGRVSKLEVYEGSGDHLIIHYDRGWDHRNLTPKRGTKEMAVVNAIIARYPSNRKVG